MVQAENVGEGSGESSKKSVKSWEVKYEFWFCGSLAHHVLFGCLIAFPLSVSVRARLCVYRHTF